MRSEPGNRSSPCFFLSIFVFIAAVVVVYASNQVSGFGWVTPAVFYLAMPLALLLLWRWDGHAIGDLGLKIAYDWKRDLGTGFLVGLFVPQAFIILLLIAGWVKIVPAEGDLPAGLPVPLFIVAFTALFLSMLKFLFIVPLEEITFRGYYCNVAHPPLGVIGALLLSSILFSACHVPAMLNSGVPLASLGIALLSWIILGCALGAGWLRTGGRLWLPIGVHFGYNVGFSAIDPLLTAFNNAPTILAYLGPGWWTGLTRWSPETGMAGVLLELVLFIAIWIVTERKRQLHLSEK